MQSAIATSKPKAKAKSKKTKTDIEAELARAEAEITQLKAHVTDFDAHFRALRDKETNIRNENERLRQVEDLLNWGFEQQEAVLHEAVEMGIELAHAVLEQRYILEQKLDQKWRNERQVSNGSEHEVAASQPMQA